MKDHFATLGLSRDATDVEVKAAYRLLVKRTHPDAAAGLPVERFLDVQAAWEVLKDPSGRARHRAELLGADSGVLRAAERTARVPKPFAPLRQISLDDLRLEIELERSMAVRGGHFTTRVPLDIECPGCHGHAMARPACDLCAGDGRLVLRVRSSLLIPAGVRHGEEIQVDCYFELFGHRVATARVYLV